MALVLISRLVYIVLFNLNESLAKVNTTLWTTNCPPNLPNFTPHKFMLNDLKDDNQHLSENVIAIFSSMYFFNVHITPRRHLLPIYSD